MSRPVRIAWFGALRRRCVSTRTHARVGFNSGLFQVEHPHPIASIRCIASPRALQAGSVPPLSRFQLQTGPGSSPAACIGQALVLRLSTASRPLRVSADPPMLGCPGSMRAGEQSLLQGQSRRSCSDRFSHAHA